MAMSLKFSQEASETKKTSIQGTVTYHKEDQRELQYFIECAPCWNGSLVMPYNSGTTSEDVNDSKHAFPGFIWTILMRR